MSLSGVESYAANIFFKEGRSFVSSDPKTQPFMRLASIRFQSPLELKSVTG